MCCESQTLGKADPEGCHELWRRFSDPGFPRSMDNFIGENKKNILNGLGLCNDRPEWAELWSHVVLKRAEP